MSLLPGTGHMISSEMHHQVPENFHSLKLWRDMSVVMFTGMAFSPDISLSEQEEAGPSIS